jgi:predicted GNAT superfamily acetyltransferase
VATPAGPSGGFAFRPLRKPEEFRHAEDLQREALGSDDAIAVPAAVLRSLQDSGGLVLGAFADIYLAGVAVSSIGWDGSSLYHLSLATVVRPEYRSHRVGFRLKAFQRDEVMRLGLSEIRWSFDPLQRAAASLGVRRLGARPDRYLTNHFGHLESAGRSTRATASACAGRSRPRRWSTGSRASSRPPRTTGDTRRRRSPS